MKKNFLLPLLFVAGVVFAQEPVTKFDYYFKKSAYKYRINSKVLKAICYNESGFNPFAIAVSKKGKVVKSFLPKDKEEALRILQRLKKEKNINYDVGLCQINRKEIEELRIKPEALLKPRVNIEVAAFILKRKILKRGYNWRAVSSYNGSETYYKKIIKTLKRWKLIE